MIRKYCSIFPLWKQLKTSAVWIKFLIQSPSFRRRQISIVYSFFKSSSQLNMLIGSLLNYSILHLADRYYFHKNPPYQNHYTNRIVKSLKKLNIILTKLTVILIFIFYTFRALNSSQINLI